jgi:hypothetical protein
MEKRISGVVNVQDLACLIAGLHIVSCLACCSGAFFRSLLRALPFQFKGFAVKLLSPSPGMPGFTPCFFSQGFAVSIPFNTERDGR